ncbi:type VII secretion protein EssC [Psychrobacillus lasiicapitis]|uniref:Type VII secretion protein EssC n=1 Tax=Psychrobacillus lasiicapitis TaxID=1636719 RepID=A0A544T2S5_9BACI|nr:type VII secretion protein EssC [Psychrobacillus lasiicapitis]TQR11766.1 type VII secretion protein EssC [Psychrobacillus lasiicapitis]GGA19271.1 ESX secretion system protein YukB [Psychrobacillus lasiicapitis]
MLQLWLFYGEYYQRISINENDSVPFTIGSKVENDVTIQTYPFINGNITVKKEDKILSVYSGDEYVGKLTDEEGLRIDQEDKVLHLYATSAALTTKTYFIDYEQEISFDCQLETATFKRENVQFQHVESGHFSLNKIKDGWIIKKAFGSPLYVNGKRCESNTILKTGDIIQWAFMEMKLIERDRLEVITSSQYETSLSEIDVPKSEIFHMYPDYRRTPRMIYDLPEDKVSISFPTQESDDNGRGLLLTIALPLVMLIVLGLVAYFIPRGSFIIISMAMFVAVLVMSTVQFFKDRKKRKLNAEKRLRVYTAYLENIRQELYELSEKQKKVLAYHFPPFEEMKQMTNSLSGRIWERTLESHDFLEFRLGTGTIPSSYEVKLSSGDLANREIDDLLEQAQRMEAVYKEIPKAPITTNLSEGILGLIGKESVIKRELHQIIGQLAFSHSYHDTRFIYIFNHEEYADIEWMKWLPHFKLPHMHARGLIHNEETRDQLLSSLYELIRERDIDELKGKVKFAPHLIFIISDYSLLAEHVILEYLESKNTKELGISVIFAESAQERMTENVHTLVRYVNEQEGDILIEAGKAVDIPFRLDGYDKTTNERFARMLRTLNHQIGIKNSIPDSVSFLEMFGVRDVADVPISRNWTMNESAKSLAVPIGFKGKDELVQLNLHEKAHGPHGLLAGTTGSGKSEFLQTYILSLAVHFHPHEVAFLLIDYKGGGMAQPFRQIPHLLGTITNIEGSKNFSMRALASINSELKRRQRLFDQYTVTHIDDYTTLYKTGKAAEPLPHLFLISDEFAELKSEEPEFIRELVSTARIGRSLGVHLILATQKPGGIIDDQIWSNARFRVALKVQDASDSKEILKNSDAASITVTGRGYLQVGNNEVYELFQSAWSGAAYMEEVLEGEDDVAIVTDLGLYPLSGIAINGKKKSSGVTEIEAVTAKIAETTATLNIQKLASPWLPPLALRMEKQVTTVPLQKGVPIGVIDEPEKQSQTQMNYDWSKDGNLGVFGSSGYGKSYTLLTALLGIAEQLRPSEANFYILDYGNGSLLPLKQLPQTADYFTIDEELKREKLIKRIKDEIAKRKIVFQQREVSNIHMYNKLSEQKLPFIYLVVDNYDIVREEMEELESQLIQFGRDGQSLGIYLFIAATRVQSVRQSLMNNLKTKVVHYLLDATEAFTVIGRVPFNLEPFPGRAILKKEDAYFTQIYLPSKGADDFEVLESMKRNIQALQDKYRGEVLPSPIAMLPLELTSIHFAAYLEPKLKDGLVPIGLDEETVLPISIDFKKNRHCLLVGQVQRGKTNTLKWMLTTLMEQQTGFIGVFDSFDRGLSTFSNNSAIDYLETKESLVEWISRVEQYYAEVEKTYVENLQQGNAVEVVLSYFVIDGYTRFLQVADIGIQDRLSKMMKNYAHLGFNVIVSGNNAEISKGYDAFTNELKLVRQAILYTKKSEQTLYTLAYERKEAELPLGFAHYMLNGSTTKVQLPLCKMERKILQ